MTPGREPIVDQEGRHYWSEDAVETRGQAISRRHRVYPYPVFLSLSSAKIVGICVHPCIFHG